MSAATSRITLTHIVEAGVCAVLLAGWIALKAEYNPPLGDGLDGAYYFQIARHVAEGTGFSTSMSIYHMGLESLPQPAMSYPLLPLLIGGLGKVIDVRTASQLLPEALYLVSLGLCYLWVRSALARSLPRLPTWCLALSATLVTTWLSMNPVYHWASSRPYTESLGLTLVFSTLLAYGAARTVIFRSQRSQTGAFLAIGLLAGLCYLARFQLAVVTLGLALSEVSQRGKKGLRDALCILLGASLPIGVWAVRYLAMPNAELRALFDFAAYRQLPSLPRFDYAVPCGTFLQCSLDKLGGIVEAFDPRKSHSYVAQFGLVTFCLPVAGALLLLRARSEPSPLVGLREPRHASWVASVWIGLLSVIPIHLVHSLHWRSWAFGWRQGLPLLFLLVPASLWLLTTTKSQARWLVLAAFAVGIVTLGAKTLSLPERDAPPGWLEAREAAAHYLEKVALKGRTLGIEPQPIAAFTNAPLDWLACWSPPELADALVRERGVNRAVLSVEELRCPSLALIRSRLALEQTLGPGRNMGVFQIRAQP